MSSFFPEDIAADLPARRDDEPESLRQDILDELADHLQCAMNRELHRHGDSFKAQQQVLARFGNPAAIAARLWRDAMWEKIMTMRLTLICTVLAVALCMATAGLAWRSSVQNQELLETFAASLTQQNADSQRALQALASNFAEQKAQSQQMINEMQKANARPQAQQAPVNIEWNPVELGFVEGTEDGPPVQGVQVTLSMKNPPASEPRLPDLNGTSDAEGRVRFRAVHYGSYFLNAERTDPARFQSLNFSSIITVPAGDSLSKTIICPVLTPEPDTLVEVNWPDDLKDKSILFGIPPANLSKTLASGEHWFITLKGPGETPGAVPPLNSSASDSIAIMAMAKGSASAGIAGGLAGHFILGDAGALIFGDDRTWILGVDHEIGDDVNQPTKPARGPQARRFGMPLGGGVGFSGVAEFQRPQGLRVWKIAPATSQRLNWPDDDCRFQSAFVFIPDVGEQAESIAQDQTGQQALQLISGWARQYIESRMDRWPPVPPTLFHSTRSQQEDAPDTDQRKSLVVDAERQWRTGVVQSFHGNSFSQQFIRGEPNRLRITPSEEIVDWIREAIKTRHADGAEASVEEQGANVAR